jgi:cholesterol transport system auxiliary component
MSTQTSRSALLATALAASALAGCVSGLRSSVPAPQTYLLDLQLAPVAADVAAAHENLLVLAPRAAPGLGTDAIAVLRPGGRLDYYLGARWAAAAPAMLQTLAIDALRPSQRFALVEPDTDPFPADYVLSLEVRHFEARYGDGGPPTIHVTLIASIGRRGVSALSANVIADSEVKAQDNRLQAVVAAFEQATAKALDKLVLAVVAMPRGS